MRLLLTQIGDSTAELNKMSIESELTIREHCDSIRQKIDIARETALENIHKASNTLITEIDAYECERLSSWTAAKESNEDVVGDVSNRTRAFLAQQQEFLRSVQKREGESTLRLEAANKLAQELNERKMELKAAMFGNKLASFIAFLSMDDVYLGELAFSTIRLPFKTLDIANNDALTQFDIRTEYDFVLPLEDGQRIVTFRSHEAATQMNCIDRLGRLIGSVKLESFVERENVGQCGPKQFVVFHYCYSPELSVYNSSLHRLRTVECKNFSNICCNSQFVFGLWDTRYSNHDEQDSDDEQENKEYSIQRIQVRHLDTLSKAFGLRVPEKYEIERIMADEQHVVTMSRAGSEWFMSVFDLATFNPQGVDRGAIKRAGGNLFLAEKHVLLDLGPHFRLDLDYLSKVFSFDGWLVVPRQRRELVWFDKNGARSETRTQLDNKHVQEFYATGKIIILTTHDDKLLLKR